MSEPTDLQQIISKNIEHIRSIVQDCSTYSVVGYSLVNSRKGFAQSELSSPAKQIRLLLGIMLETDEPPDSKEFTVKEWGQVVKPLQTLSGAYMQLYLPAKGVEADQSEDWRLKQVPMTAFLDYHQKGLLASAEQIGDRIRSYLSPFDDRLSKILGISASGALDIALCVGQQFQEQMDRVTQNALPLPIQSETSLDLVQALDRLGKTRRSDLVEQYGELGKAFWDLFTVRRGEGPQINYPTERSVVETRPWIVIFNDEAMLFDFNILLSAILQRCEEALAKDSIRGQYFRRRDHILEDQTASILQRILGRGSQIYRNVFETPSNQYEHDLVIFNSDICMFVEVKATPMGEPFRDPEKALIRLQRSFRSESGIQKAYDQSLRLYKLLQEQDLVLYDAKGTEILRLPSSYSDKAFCVCVTRDSFGPIATCLSPLLSKGVDDPYPWVVNIWDLEQVAEGWEYFRWDARQLKSFLSQRIELHEKVFSDDELDYVGAYIKHCGLQQFGRHDYDLLQLDPTYSHVFDDIYFHVHHGQPRVKINPSYPEMSDFQESLKTGKRVSVENAPEGLITVGRNELCPCGSTVKFKWCHDR